MKNCIVIFSLLFIFNAFALFAQVTPSVDVTENGVGIGTAAPQEMLDVNGRVRDKTGIIMPIGTILSFAGAASMVPEGWLICDGRAMTADDYPDLFTIIGTTYGDGSTDTRLTAIEGDFNIPDLRGVFVRGLDNPETESGPAGNDPDSEIRALGAYQENAFQGHDHNMYLQTGHDSNVRPLKPGRGIGGGGRGTTFASTLNEQRLFDGYSEDSQGRGVPNVSTETRPKNVALNYIIKY